MFTDVGLSALKSLPSLDGKHESLDGKHKPFAFKRGRDGHPSLGQLDYQ